MYCWFSKSSHKVDMCTPHEQYAWLQHVHSNGPCLMTCNHNHCNAISFHSCTFSQIWQFQCLNIKKRIIMEPHSQRSNCQLSQHLFYILRSFNPQGVFCTRWYKRFNGVSRYKWSTPSISAMSKLNWKHEYHRLHLFLYLTCLAVYRWAWEWNLFWWLL